MPQVRGAVCANINLLMEKEEEDFEKYLPMFATDVWGLLTGVTLEPRQVGALPLMMFSSSPQFAACCVL